MSVCQKCHKEFKYNYLLKRHMNKKIDCSNIQNNNIYNVLQNNKNEINNLIKLKPILSSYSIKLLISCVPPFFSLITCPTSKFVFEITTFLQHKHLCFIICSPI